MTAKSIAASKTEIQIGDSATPEVFTKIGEVTDFGGLGRGLNTYEKTTLDSDFQEFAPGLKTIPAISFSMNETPTDSGQVALDADCASGTARNFKIVLADTAATTFDFEALITAYAITGTHGDKVTSAITLTPTGKNFDKS